MSSNGGIALNECAGCGKKANDLKMCVACKEVRYCNVKCQKQHRPQHKDRCKKRSAELRDKSLFKQPPKEECAICFLPVPDSDSVTFMPCCGKELCNGCIYAVAGESFGNCKCPFCRAPPPKTNEAYIGRIKKRMEANDAEAFVFMAMKYGEGTMGVPKDEGKYKELLLKAVELGSSDACRCLAIDYLQGSLGMKKDEKKSQHYWEIAAMEGCVKSRLNLATAEWNKGESHKAMQHYIIGARAGNDECLGFVKAGYLQKLIDKHVFEEVLRAHKEASDEMKSNQREAATQFLNRNGPQSFRVL